MKKAYIQYILASFLRTPEFDAQVGEEWIFDESYRGIAKVAIIAAFDRLGLAVNPETYYNEFNEIFSTLQGGSGVTYDGDEYTDQWFKFNLPNKNQIIDNIIQTNEAHQRISRLGVSGPIALERALRKILDEDRNLHAIGNDIVETLSIENIEIQIPASDRLVSRSDNQTSIEQIETNLKELSSLVLSKDNEVGALIGDQREVVELEFDLAKTAISRPRFRLASLVGWLTPVLKFLADKFAGGAIADLAKRLLELLLSLA